MKKTWKSFFISMLVLIMLTVLLTPVVSAEEYETVPYNTYTYWTRGNNREAVSIRQVYEAKYKFNGAALGTSEMSEPNDIDVDGNGNLYVLDSGNSRILVIDEHQKLLRVIEKPVGNGETFDYSGAEGIYLDDNGLIYIADTKNTRVLVLNNDGTLNKVILKPESDVVPEDFSYSPMKVVTDSRGFVFVLSRGSYYGAVVYDSEGEFLGFYGANTVQTTVLDLFGKLWDRLTQTEAKRAASVQKLPYQFVSMAIDNDDFIYTLTGLTDSWYSAGTGHIRRLNPAGNNIYKDINGDSSDSINFTDEGDFKTDKSMPRLSSFTKLCTDDNGYVYALDATYGHIFIYDSQCNCIAVFGDGLGDGNQLGTFIRPESVAVYEDKMYVLDILNSSITVFRLTDYGKTYMQAQNLTLNGDYAGSVELWEKVHTADKNNQLAYIGLAQAALIEGDYETAMKYAKAGADQTDYAVAFEQKRAAFFAENVWWMILVAVAIMAMLVAWAIYRKKHPKERRENAFSFAMSTVFHPFDSFYQLKYKQKGSIKMSLALLLVYYIARVAGDIYSGFSFNLFDPAEYNSIITLLGSIGVVLLWTVVNWGVCVLAQGKGRLREIFMVICYALIPEIVASLLSLVFTNILVPEEATILNILTVCCHIITAIILCIGTMVIHEYDFFKFIGTTILTVLGMLLIIFIIFMVFILFQELFTFLGSIYKEAFYQ